MTMKVAIIGIGGISGAHISAWKKQENVTVAALCDIRPSQMEPYPEYPHYTDFDEMLEKEAFDILDICLPTYLHADYAVKAMERGLHVICEKPLSLKKEDVKRVYDTARRHKVQFMVAQVLRFWDEYEFVKKCYEEKTYGRLLSGQMSRMNHCPTWSWDDWMKDEKRSGLAPFDLHIHDLDFLRYAFGKPTHIEAHRAKTPYQDYIHGVYTFGDFFVSAEASWYAPADFPFSAEFLFQFEAAVLALKQGKLTVYEASGRTFCPIGAGEGDTGHIGLPQSNAYENEIVYFLHCVSENRLPDKINPAELEDVLDILLSL